VGGAAQTNVSVVLPFWIKENLLQEKKKEKKENTQLGCLSKVILACLYS